jgi:GH15 family glucan-1,4-alpha-glucosidase
MNMPASRGGVLNVASADRERPVGPRHAIGEYALIGNSRTAALVSTNGSVDWLCLPRFDSPSLFGALLDGGAGHFSIRPSGRFDVRRRYLPDTTVLETTFTTPAGRVALRDAMTVDADRRSPVPEHELLRELTGLDGEVDLVIEYAPRPDYATRSAGLDDRGRLGISSPVEGGLVTLRTDVRLDVTAGMASGRLRVQAGERHCLSLAFDRDAPAVLVDVGHLAGHRLDHTVRWWQSWAERCTYDGRYREVVVRSALTLKLLTYAPSGAIIAAPTTSLPEVIGGERNWDYRYCWLRDASFTIRALFDLGYALEGEAFFGWLLHATRLTHPELQVVYDVFGNTNLPEHELEHLDGYAGSRPVRIGNGACSQLQLDVYGEIVDAAVRYADRGGRFDADQRRMLVGLGDTVCRRWREPDEGIWEPRGGRRHHTHSKALAWVALDGLIRLHEAGRLHAPVDRFRREAAILRAQVERRGWNADAASYTQRLDDGSAEVDASLLTLPLYGFMPAADARMRSTVDRIRRDLASGPLVRRYRPEAGDGLSGAEGAFGICTFWLVEVLALAGEVDEATGLFEQALGYANDVGLWAEEIDVPSGEALGNFPQGLTHIGLINAALTLQKVTN